MNDFVSFAAKNKTLLNLVSAVLLLVFFSFCPICDILGKATFNGFELVFDGKGMGFLRFLGAMMMLVPLFQLIVVCIYIPALKPHKELLMLICPIVCLVLALLLAMNAPKGLSIAWGAYLYMIVAVASSIINYLVKSAEKNK